MKETISTKQLHNRSFRRPDRNARNFRKLCNICKYFLLPFVRLKPTNLIGEQFGRFAVFGDFFLKSFYKPVVFILPVHFHLLREERLSKLQPYCFRLFRCCLAFPLIHELPKHQAEPFS